MPRPLRPECALVLEGYAEVLWAKGMAERTPVPKAGPIDPKVYQRIGKDRGSSWPERDPYPIITVRDPIPEDVVRPKAVNQLVDLLLEHGWIGIRVGYSLGYRRQTTIGKYRKAEAWGVYTAPHPDTGMRVTAVYERNPDTKSKSWSWSSLSVSGPGRTLFAGLNVTQVKEWISVQGVKDELWYRRIVRENEAKDVRAKASAKARPKAAGEHGG